MHIGQEMDEGAVRAAWEGSNVMAADIEWLRKTRRIPPKVSCRLPGPEISPVLESGEVVVFVAHFKRGLGLPVSDFFRKFLEKFSLQPHHLPANALVTLSSYVSFTEAYLGLWPSINLWAKLFSFRPQVIPDPLNEGEKPMTECGAATVIPRRGSIFPRIQGLESCKKWLRTFFYVKNTTATDMINLPAYVAGPPIEKLNWGYNPNQCIAEVNEIYQYIDQLKNQNRLSADDLLATFIQRRVSPLQRRTHKMCHMSGRHDPSRITTFELMNAEVQRQVKAIAKTTMAAQWVWGMEPFSRDRLPPSKFPRQVAEDGTKPADKWPADREDSDTEDPDASANVPAPEEEEGNVGTGQGHLTGQVLEVQPLAKSGRGTKRASARQKKRLPKRRKGPLAGSMAAPMSSGAPLVTEQSASGITSPLAPQPPSPIPEDRSTSAPAPPNSPPAGQYPLPIAPGAGTEQQGGSAGTEEERAAERAQDNTAAPEDEEMDRGDGDYSTPGGGDDGRDAQDMDAETEGAKSTEAPEQPEQQQKQQQQPQPPPEQQQQRQQPQPPPEQQQQQQQQTQPPPEQQQQRPASPKELEQQQRPTQQQQGPSALPPEQASAQGMSKDNQLAKPAFAKSASAPPKPSQEMHLSLHVSKAAATFKTSQISSRTMSGGNSLGSLGKYAMDWNDADMDEVNSFAVNPHPAVPGAISMKMYKVKLSLQEAEKSIATCTDTRTRLYRELLTEHRHLSDRHKSVLARLKKAEAEAKDPPQVKELQEQLAEARAEKEVLEKRLKDSILISESMSQLKERDDRHEEALKKLQDEVTRLKGQGRKAEKRAEGRDLSDLRIQPARNCRGN